jgi:hypothetical protein
MRTISGFITLIRERMKMTKTAEKNPKILNHKIFIVDEKTVIVEGIGKATDVGTLDMRKFIEVAMSLKSFWN